ncbi:MAG: MAPEG family protein [Chloroflexota bacterium]
MTITMITTGLLALLLLFLSGYVIAGRVKFKIDIGDGGNETMRQRIRAQANFTEYVPVALILMLLMETGSVGPAWLLVAMGVTLVIARLWHAQGLLSNPGTSAGRFMGANLTGLVILVGAVAALGRGSGVW